MRGVFRRGGPSSSTTSSSDGRLRGARSLPSFRKSAVISRSLPQPAYAEPAIGWNTEDNKAGVIKYGVADYEPRTSKAPIRTPTRPALPAPPDTPQDGGDGDMLALM